MKSVIRFFKEDIVLTVSAILSILSAFFVKPGIGYLAYPDYKTLSLLFCLMAVVAGFQSIGLFDHIGAWLLAGIQNTRQLRLSLICLTFFSSMFVTNDVALITFVPFTILLLKMAGEEKQLIRLVVLETIAANLGSMLTPVGNPQNLYLYSVSGMSFLTFFQTVFPYALLSFVLLMIAGSMGKADNVEIQENLPSESREQKHNYKFHLWIYIGLFFSSLLAVFHIVPYQLSLLLVVGVIFFIRPVILRQVDYHLLLTFLCFFVFIGNIKEISAISDMMEKLVSGREMMTGILLSQVISNVPAAILLSGFTTSYEALLVGVNLGGLGTLIASLASLISYKYYTRSQQGESGTYLRSFTIQNIAFLVILLLFAFLRQRMGQI